LSERVPSVVVISAPSGAGKSTLLGRVLREVEGFRFSVSHTTRPPRPTETSGVQYHFVGPADFESLIREDRLLEWAEVHGHRYGTSRAEHERAVAEGKDLVLDLDVQGAAQIRRRFRDAVTVFILPPSYADLERRLRGRGHDDEATIRKRLEVAREEMGHYLEYDFAVVNDDVERCVQGLKSVIAAARLRTRQVQPTADRILRTFDKQGDD
jgi:guanylate kinase